MFLGFDVGFHVFVQTMGIRLGMERSRISSPQVLVSLNGHRVQNTCNYIQQYRIRLWRPGVTDVVPGLPLTAADWKAWKAVNGWFNSGPHQEFYCHHSHPLQLRLSLAPVPQFTVHTEFTFSYIGPPVALHPRGVAMIYSGPSPP